MDNASCVIVGVEATAARLSQETVAAQTMLTRFAARHGGKPQSLAADTTYGNGEFLHWLGERDIASYMRTRDDVTAKTAPSTARNSSPTNRKPTAIAARRGRSQLWRAHVGRPGPSVYRDAQALRGLSAEAAVYRRSLPPTGDSCARSSAAAGARVAATPAYEQAQRQRKKVETVRE